MNLNEYPAAIEDARLKLQRLTDEADKLREYMGEIEDQITANVANALDGNDKPLYSNETKRKAAIATDLKASGPYQTQVALLADVERGMKQADARLERLRGEFAAAKIERNERLADKLSSCALG